MPVLDERHTSASKFSRIIAIRAAQGFNHARDAGVQRREIEVVTSEQRGNFIQFVDFDGFTFTTAAI